jgi:hypothetical protein
MDRLKLYRIWVVGTINRKTPLGMSY